MNFTQVLGRLIQSLVSTVTEAVEAYVNGDPSKLEKVQQVLPPGERLQSEEVMALETEKAKRLVMAQD